MYSYKKYNHPIFFITLRTKRDALAALGTYIYLNYL